VARPRRAIVVGFELIEKPEERVFRQAWAGKSVDEIDVDGPAREGMIESARIILKSSGVLAYDPVTKIILDNCARAYFEWAVEPWWRVRTRRRNHDRYVSAVDRLIRHVRDKVLLQETYR
jgi:hypothetical protein